MGQGRRGHKAVVRGKQLWRSWEMAAAPRRHLKGCSEGQHPTQEPGALNAESPGTPAQHPSMLDAEALPPHSPSQPGCLPATHRSAGEEPCAKAPGAHPQQHLSTHGQLLPTGCTGAQGQRNTMEARFLNRNMKHPQEGQPLELECMPFNIDNGVSWIRQDKDGKLHFIVYISPLSRTAFPRNERTSSQFEGSKQGSSFRLVVKNFRAQDQGTYFCIANINQMLYFSSGQPAFFPATTTAAPTTAAATTQSSHVNKDICMPSSEPGTSGENILNLYCEIFIWAPLAGVCLVLLVALIVTIVLCQKTRRRRCRCKRPPNGKPGAKPCVPTRHI